MGIFDNNLKRTQLGYQFDRNVYIGYQTNDNRVVTVKELDAAVSVGINNAIYTGGSGSASGTIDLDLNIFGSHYITTANGSNQITVEYNGQVNTIDIVPTQVQAIDSDLPDGARFCILVPSASGTYYDIYTQSFDTVDVVTTISSTSDDTEIPTAKAVWDVLAYAPGIHSVTSSSGAAGATLAVTSLNYEGSDQELEYHLEPVYSKANTSTLAIASASATDITTTISSSSSNSQIPTAQAVWNVLSEAPGIRDVVGTSTSTGASMAVTELDYDGSDQVLNYTLQPVYSQNNTDTLSIIGASGVDITTTISSGSSTKIPTEGAVYNFAASAGTIEADPGPIVYALGLIGDSRLPEGYQQIAYIQTTGTQYIDTGFQTTTEKLKIEFKCSFPAGANDVSLFGSNSPYNIVPWTSGGANTFTHWVGTSSGILPITYSLGDNEVVYELDNGTLTCTINGVTSQTSYIGSIVNNYNFYIFGKNGRDSSVENGSYRLYYFKLYNNDVLVRDFIPCRRKSDSVVGLYDAVNNVFYTNQGSGIFVSGADIISNHPYYTHNIDNLVSVSGPNPATLSWSSTVTVATVAGHNINVDMPDTSQFAIAIAGAVNITTTIASGSADIPTADAVYQAIESAPGIASVSHSTGGSTTTFVNGITYNSGNRTLSYTTETVSIPPIPTVPTVANACASNVNVASATHGHSITVTCTLSGNTGVLHFGSFDVNTGVLTISSGDITINCTGSAGNCDASTSVAGPSHGHSLS